ncbi:hypothetical protein U1Q18_049321 [Sarracenia purpurea var. burkii]
MNRFEEVLIPDSIRERIPEGFPKFFFISYTLYGGFLFDERINKKFRIIWSIYNAFSVMVWLISCIFYLSDLMVYDLLVMALTALSLGSSLMVGGTLFTAYYNKESIMEIMEFFLTDRIPEPRIFTELYENDAKKENKLINGNKLIKLALAVFVIAIVSMTALFDTIRSLEISRAREDSTFSSLSQCGAL